MLALPSLSILLTRNCFILNSIFVYLTVVFFLSHLILLLFPLREVCFVTLYVFPTLFSFCLSSSYTSSLLPSSLSCPLSTALFHTPFMYGWFCHFLRPLYVLFYSRSLSFPSLYVIYLFSSHSCLPSALRDLTSSPSLVSFPASRSSASSCPARCNLPPEHRLAQGRSLSINYSHTDLWPALEGRVLVRNGRRKRWGRTSSRKRRGIRRRTRKRTRRRQARWRRESKRNK